MAVTLYDLQKQNEEEREKRSANLRELKSKLQEAKNVLSVIPNNGIENEQERRCVKAQIRDLNKLIDDEEKAYKVTFEGLETEAEKIANMLNI